MVQTDLKSDNFCGYNTSAAPFFWILDPVQNSVEYKVGEVGVPAGVGVHTPGEVIKVSNFLSDRENYLTSCVPPVPPMPSSVAYSSDASISDSGLPLKTQGFNEFTDRKKLNSDVIENFHNDTHGAKNLPNYSQKVSRADGNIVHKEINTSEFLLPETTNVKRSAKDYSAVNFHGGFAGNGGNLHTDPQNLTYVIERMWLERGGLDQNQMIKQSQEKFVPNTYETGPDQLKTCEKIRQPYNTKYPFGLPANLKTGEPIEHEQSKHFNAIDVTSLGISSPLLEQNPRIPFNYEAMISNGGCNEISYLRNNKMCSNQNNDLTGINDYHFANDMPPPGVH